MYIYIHTYIFIYVNMLLKLFYASNATDFDIRSPILFEMFVTSTSFHLGPLNQH